MKTLQDDIKQLIIDQVSAAIEEFDFERYIDKKEIEQIIKKEIRGMIVSSLVDHIQNKIISSIERITPPVDREVEQIVFDLAQSVLAPLKEKKKS